MIGIDEVGRGCWAGPLLVVAARQIDELPNDVRDSKEINSRQRQYLYNQIKQSCNFGEGWVQPEEIDKQGLTAAMKIGVSRALLNLGALFDDEIIMDGHINYCPTEFVKAQTIVGADKRYPVVSAASIYAKVLRDEHMTRLARFYPYYGFERHFGYGTQLHQSALKVHGICTIHRRSFSPIKTFL